MHAGKRLAAELIGTFWLVFGGCGSAVLAAVFFTAPEHVSIGIGLSGVSLAFGLTVLTGAYAFGHVSGGHFNPAVTLGLVASRRFPVRDAPLYIAAQLVGAIVAAAAIWLIAIGKDGMTAETLAQSGLAANGYGEHSPGGYSMLAALVAEIVLTALFLFVILGATARGATAPVAGVAIGLCLTLIHLVSIPVTNTSVNPARSTGPALMVLFGGESWPVAQLWLFWLAPIAGALLAGVTYEAVLPYQDEPLASGVPEA